MKTKNDFTHQLLSLVLPISFQMFMLSLVSVSDAVMLGKLNQDSLSAVSLGSQIAFVFNLFIGAITMGESMFVAQFWGKKDMLHIHLKKLMNWNMHMPLQCTNRREVSIRRWCCRCLTDRECL